MTFGRTHARDRSRGHGSPLSIDAGIPAFLADWNADLNVISSAGAVSAWTDTSQNAYVLQQLTGAKRPTLVANAFNGHAGIAGNGTSSTMASLLAIPLSQPFTVYLVVKATTVAANSVIFDNTSNGLAEFYYNASQTGMYASTVLTGTGVPSGAAEIYSIVFSGGSTSTVYRNNVLLVGPGSAGASSGTGVTLFSQMGGVNPAPVTIGRCLLSAAADSLPVQQFVVRSLGATYAVTVS